MVISGRAIELVLIPLRAFGMCEKTINGEGRKEEATKSKANSTGDKTKATPEHGYESIQVELTVSYSK